MGAPPRGLRWREESPLSAQLRPRISRFYFYLFAAVWNFALVAGDALHPLGTPTRPPAGLFDVVGLGAGVLFVLLAVRELALTTNVDFHGGQLVIRAPLAPWVRFDAPLTRIAGFSVLPNEDGTHSVYADIREDLDRILPLDFETIGLRASGSRKRPFASPVSYASFLAGRLGEMLEAARRSGNPS